MRWLAAIAVIVIGIYSFAETITAERNYIYYKEPAR